MITPHDIQAISLGYCITAVVLTISRIVIRKRVRWWWDDLFAVTGAIAIVFQTIILWLLNENVPVIMHNRTTGIAFFYLNSICFYFQDWSARLALLYSIVRITPDPLTRRILYYVAMLFVLAALVNVGMLLGYCESNPAWKQMTSPVCIVAKPVPYIYQITVGITADTFLISISMHTVKVLQSTPILRRRLIIIFSASVFMTISCVTQSALSLKSPGFDQLIASLTEGFIALVVCNLAVVVTAILHLFRIGNGDGNSSKKQRANFTSIRFNITSSQTNVSDSGVGLRTGNETINIGPTVEPTGGVSLMVPSVKVGLGNDDGNSVIDGTYKDVPDRDAPPNPASSDASNTHENMPVARRTKTFIERWRNMDVDIEQDVALSLARDISEETKGAHLQLKTLP